MANAAVAAWTACIRDLQKLVGGSRPVPDTAQIAERVTELAGDPNAPLPNAAWKKLVHDAQVTRQLSALCIQAHQQKAALAIRTFATCLLGLWLHKATSAFHASPTSRLAASVRQQLQGSGLLQHMAAMFTDAADSLTATAAVAFGEPAHSTAGSSRGRSSSSSSSLPGGGGGNVSKDAAHRLWDTLGLVDKLLDLYSRAYGMMSATAAESVSLSAALPAAPAAVRLILTTFQTCSRLQQLADRGYMPAPVQLLAADAAFLASCAATLGGAYISVLGTANVVLALSNQGTLQFMPGARELLSCPELVPCLAITVLVAVLGFDTGVPGSASNGAVARGEGASSSATDGTSGAGSSSGVQASTRQCALQQQTTFAASCSAGVHPHYASSSGAGSISSGRLGNGVDLDSVTPLSCGLFGLLGVEQGLLLTAMEGAKTTTHATWGVNNIIAVFNVVVAHQVDEALGACREIDAQLLLHVETDMLLGLMVHQLTASIPASYPGAQEVRQWACQLQCYSLMKLFQRITCSLHKLPLSAPYTGPQLALQVMPSPLGLPSAVQQPQQQKPQWCTVAPTAQLLTELLPLLTSYCMAGVQQQHCAAGQPEAFRGPAVQLQQHAISAEQAATVQGSSAHAYAHLLKTLKSVTGCVDLGSVQKCVMHMGTLLATSMVPDPNLTAAEVQAAAAAVAASAEQYRLARAAYRCVLHAPEAVIQNAAGVVCLCDALLRDAAALCAKAVQSQDGSGAANAGTAKQVDISGVEAAEQHLEWLMMVFGAVVGHNVTGSFPHQPSALALAALSAGPGSDLQRQLFSLLCTMVKLGSAPVGSIVSEAIADKSVTERTYMLANAARTAAALLVADQERPPPSPSADGGIAKAAVSMLAGLFVVGRCCAWWARLLQSQDALEAFAQRLAQQPLPAELVLPPVQQWLQASSTQEQLVAAGYAPQALLQQLQQAVVALQVVRDNVVSGQLDSPCLLEAAQQLQAAGRDLCSFATPYLCNNPSCANLSGLTELGLVSGRSCVCGGCRVARYCGRACQRAAWKQHKPVCAALAAAGAAPAAAGPAAGAPLSPASAGV